MKEAFIERLEKAGLSRIALEMYFLPSLVHDECHASMSKRTHSPFFVKLRFVGNNKLERFAAVRAWEGGVYSKLPLSAEVWSSELREESLVCGGVLRALPAALKTSSESLPASHWAPLSGMGK